jgi:hypothetical protein
MFCGKLTLVIMQVMLFYWKMVVYKFKVHKEKLFGKIDKNVASLFFCFFYFFVFFTFLFIFFIVSLILFFYKVFLVLLYM